MTEIRASGVDHTTGRPDARAQGRWTATATLRTGDMANCPYDSDVT